MATFTEAFNELKRVWREEPEDSKEQERHISCSGPLEGFLALQAEIGVYGSTNPDVFAIYLDLLPDEDSEHTKIGTLSFSLGGMELSSAGSLSEEEVSDVMETLGLLSAEWEMSEP